MYRICVCVWHEFMLKWHNNTAHMVGRECCKFYQEFFLLGKIETKDKSLWKQVTQHIHTDRHAGKYFKCILIHSPYCNNRAQRTVSVCVPKKKQDYKYKEKKKKELLQKCWVYLWLFLWIKWLKLFWQKKKKISSVD